MTRTLISRYARFPRRAATPKFFRLGQSSPQTPSCASALTPTQWLPTSSRALHTSSRLLSRPDDTKTNNHENPNPNPTPKSRKSRLLLPIAVPITLALTLLYLDTPTQPPTTAATTAASKPLNPTSFTPFTILARDQVSPTAFILTVAPPPETKPAVTAATADAVRRAWEHGLWAVEIKQPQLQVARDYTPLPALLQGEGEGGNGGEMRFLIRKMEKGEVSSYLSGLGVGDVVELRGPRLGFDVCERVGGTGVEEKKKVVFLAGGTGIAPALQAARALLRKREGVEMEVVWANRRREDCIKGEVVDMLEELRRGSEGRFNYVCTVDEEGSFIDAKTITGATGLSTAAGGRASWWWPFGSANSGNVASPGITMISDACRYHSSKKLVVSDDRDDLTDSGDENCRCEDGTGRPIPGSKNLLMVSGPDGFIERFTGAKVWAGGKELQGPIKGVVGELRRKYPSLGDDWLVLKL